MGFLLAIIQFITDWFERRKKKQKGLKSDVFVDIDSLSRSEGGISGTKHHPKTTMERMTSKLVSAVVLCCVASTVLLYLGVSSEQTDAEAAIRSM